MTDSAAEQPTTDCLTPWNYLRLVESIIKGCIQRKGSNTDNCRSRKVGMGEKHRWRWIV